MEIFTQRLYDLGVKNSELEDTISQPANPNLEKFAEVLLEKVDARVIAFDKKTRKLQVSIKALEIAEEKEAVAQYGSTDSGASLGDILGAALKKQNAKD